MSENGGEKELAEGLVQLQRRQRWMEIAVGGLLVLLICAAAVAWRAIDKLAHPQSLTLRRLDIVDANGRSRVILAAPVPPPVFFGKVGKRDGAASGVLILDGTGTERGGYVTGDAQEANALLTLDAQGKQTVLLLAEPEGSTLFRIWDRDHGSIVMGSSEKGPFLNVRKGDEIFLSTPKGNPEANDARPLFR